MKLIQTLIAIAVVVPSLAFAAAEKKTTIDLTGKVNAQNEGAILKAAQDNAKGAKVSITGNSLVVESKSKVNVKAIEEAVAKAATPTTTTTTTGTTTTTTTGTPDETTAPAAPTTPPATTTVPSTK